MLKRHRLSFGALLGIVAVSAVLLVGKYNEPNCAQVLWQLSSAEAPKEDKESNYSSAVTCESDCQVTFFRSSQGDQQTDSKSKSTNTHCDTSEELDLLAQTRMAHWTAYIAGLTGIGLLLLMGTLVEAFRATKAAADAASATKAQTIAYLGVTGVSWNIWGDDLAFSAKVHFEKHGPTPIKNIQLRWRFNLYEASDSAERRSRLLDSVRQTTGASDIVLNRTGLIYIRSPIFSKKIKEIRDEGGLILDIAAILSYQDVFGTRYAQRVRYHDRIWHWDRNEEHKEEQMFPGSGRAANDRWNF